jgi:hypothetical protein
MKDSNNYIKKVKILIFVFVTLLNYNSSMAQQTFEKPMLVSKNNSKTSTSLLTDEYCNSMSVIVGQSFDANGCYLEFHYNHDYSASNITNAYVLPHGFYVKIGGATISSGTICSSGNAWLTAATMISTASDELCWIRQPIVTGSNSTTAIQPLVNYCFRVYINNIVYPLNIIFRELTGWAWQSATTVNTQFWDCEAKSSREKPIKNFIIPNYTICSGQATILQLTSNPPISPNAFIEWYKCNCATNVCLDPWVSLAGWQLVQQGYLSTTCPTNLLNNTTCYAAKITEMGGCFSYWSNISQVTVCQPTAGNILVSPIPPYGQLQTISGLPSPRYCNKWSGNLQIPDVGFTCNATITWTKNGTVIATNSPPGTLIPTSLLTGSNPNACFNAYAFNAHIVFDNNACPPIDRSITIYIDRNVVAGTINVAPNYSLNICNDQVTRLIYNGTCTEILKWEQREKQGPCGQGAYSNWGAIPMDPGASNTYWTNNLTTTTQYRVKVRNGACGPVYSLPITVNVKPKLKVTLTTNNYVYCKIPNPCSTTVLTAAVDCAGLFNNLIFKWYRDGSWIATTNNVDSLSLTQLLFAPGIYYVEVSASPCGTVRSNAITICYPTANISGPLAICLGGSDTLTANVYDCCSPNCTFLWMPGGQTTQSIIVSPSSTTVYTVSVKCGCCIIKPTFKLIVCP